MLPKDEDVLRENIDNTLNSTLLFKYKVVEATFPNSVPISDLIEYTNNCVIVESDSKLTLSKYFILFYSRCVIVISLDGNQTGCVTRLKFITCG